MPIQPRLTVSTITDPAPAAPSTLAHSFVVAPVVNTSSTTTRLFMNSAGRRRANAPRTFSVRSAAMRNDCVAVSRVRRKFPPLNAAGSARTSLRVNHSAWLKCRSRSRAAATSNSASSGPRPERAVVFKPVNTVARYARQLAGADSALKEENLVRAVRTHEVPAGCAIERQTAPLTERPRQRPQFLATPVAKHAAAARFARSFANPAISRAKQLQRDVRPFLDRPNRKPSQ